VNTDRHRTWLIPGFSEISSSVILSDNFFDNWKIPFDRRCTWHARTVTFTLPLMKISKQLFKFHLERHLPPKCWGNFFCEEFPLCLSFLTKNLISACSFPLVQFYNVAAILERAFSLIARDAPMSTVSAGGQNLRLKGLPTASPYKTSLKLIQILSLIIDWPSYIDTFHKPLRVCVCVFNATGKLFHPEMLYCFRNSILCLNNSCSV